MTPTPACSNGTSIMTLDPTPAGLGYRWPAEWEPHAATWLSWPHNRATWPGKFDVIPPHYARFVRAVAAFEPLLLLAGGAAVREDAERHVGNVAGVTILDIETNDAWIRDHGPTFLPATDTQPAALIDWQYNAWGGKYPPWDKDNAVPLQIAEMYQRRRFAPQFVLEGGAIDGNGHGTVLTTESCLLSPSRNPGVSRDAVEQRLRDNLGARRVLWLSGHGLAGDDTDGHIDQLARFVNPTTVVAATSEDPGDENYASLQENWQRLRRMRDQDGHELSVVPLPVPEPLFHNDQRLPASYCNFYIINGAVIVPEFGSPADRRAHDTLAELFSTRQIIGLPALDLIWGLGAFHCLSQQEPAPGSLAGSK